MRYIRSNMLLWAALIWLSCSNVFAQKTPLYPISNIPVQLLENSNAVIREDITKYEIIDKGNGKKYSKAVVTIINKKADHFAEIHLFYSKLNKITSIEGKCIDKYGKIVKKLKSKDIEDIAAFDGYSIYSDSRMKYFDLRHPDYPYTIEYEIEEEDDGFLSTPGWIPYGRFNVASQKSYLEVKAPLNYDLRYLELNMDSAVKEKTEDDKKVIYWEFGAFPPIEKEDRMPGLREILPHVITAPSSFKMEEYEGDMSNWLSFGQWEAKLNSGRDVLPPEFSSKIKSLVASEESRTAKVRKLYEYLQKNTRYVSIQLGIGGWQTFPASDVVENGYGDCKALSNYMKAMLKTAGIESYYTLVRAGINSPNIIKEFPSNQFNHMILCVPNYQDTLWLECTSQDNPFGYLGRFTGDRDVLVINESGGEIAHTVTYEKQQNTQTQITKVILSENGSAAINLSVACAGLQYDRFSGLLDVGEDEQKKWLYRNLDLSGFELQKFSFEQEKQPVPELYSNFEITVNRFASASGKRLFLQPNVFNKLGKVKIPQKDRKYDFVLNYPYIDADTVEFQIPDGYHLEYLPEPIHIESDFGNYESQVLAGEGKVIYIRTNSMVKGQFPPEEYLKFVEFRNAVAEADQAKLVLVKST